MRHACPLCSLCEVAAAIDDLLKVMRLRQPGLVFLKLIGEENSMLKFVLMLPAAGAPDVTERLCTVAIGANGPTTWTLPGTAVESDEMAGNDNDLVTGYLVDVDDANNHSEPRSFSFTLADTIPPPRPGEIGLRITGEI